MQIRQKEKKEGVFVAFYVETPGFNDPEKLEKELDQLLNAPIETSAQLEQWLKDQSLLFDQIEEMLSGHYITFQQFNTDEAAKRAFEHDQQVIQPLLKKYTAAFNQRFYDSPFLKELDPEYYGQLIKSKKNAIELFRGENIPLEIEEDRLSTIYFEKTGSITVDWEGKEKTISQMQMYLKDPDRAIREKAWRLIQKQISGQKDELQQLMTDLINIRRQKAENAGLANYRDYMFKKYERFSYTPEDCHQLAESVLKHVVPLKEEIEQQHQQALKLDTYRPWDTQAVPAGQKPLKPFDTSEQLINGTVMMFKQLDPLIAHLLETMNQRDMLDLDSRKGKSPGGFCSELPVSKLSFIFMNAAGTQGDMTTLVHEMGHCFHNEMKKEIPLSKYRDTPMESSELASMSMELLSMHLWDIFYKDEEELKRAKREQLEGVISFLPWGVVVDQFQHWMYENPDHTVEERSSHFKELAQKYIASYVDWSGLDDELVNRWLMQLHIFEVPFYYIEYVMAQLGALQMYKQFKADHHGALANYKKALALGNSRPLPEIYEAAGIRFDFSDELLGELMDFVKAELALLA